MSNRVGIDVWMIGCHFYRAIPSYSYYGYICTPLKYMYRGVGRICLRGVRSLP